MSAIVIIPARYDSTRFPGKPLSLLKGKTLIQHVYENSQGAHLIEDVIVATDSETIFEKVLSFGGKAVMTDRSHPSGTDRIAEVATSIDYDIIVNVQGDEPLIRPQMIDDVIALLDDERASIGTLIKRITDTGEIMDPNIVKVVFDKDGFALYFSRSPIPYHRDEWKNLGQVTGHGSRVTVFKHIGIYSYRREVLLALSRMEPTELEKREKLEQLRALENGITIKIQETFFETFGVDTPEDLERVEKCLSTSL
ncbi:MAG: 3-deoxy-manno-octulosonate cytidylyltransferase [Nitrospira sp.]|nr:3-deoxy-manno-octulosonate cytidylyltransferase [Nitrospira sp.]